MLVFVGCVWHTKKNHDDDRDDDAGDGDDDVDPWCDCSCDDGDENAFVAPW